VSYKPAQIYLAVQSLCPGLAAPKDFELADLNDGQGVRIARWYNTDVSQPTQEQIEAVDTDALLAEQTTVLPQDLMAQFTADDMAAIMAQVATTPQLALLWYSFVAQRDPMRVSNDRFKAGWSALGSILGQTRSAAIAAALGIPQ
jgi:hypothetical protein